MKFYLIYKNHGLYDPVLDDYDPIYEPERPDSDLRSEPTEVTFENEITLDTLNDYLDSGVLTDRSLTESPFVPNTKPYRPFSTEPLDVPPLDDPIILNPNFKDELSTEEKKNEVLSPEEDDLLKLLPLYNNVEAKFKLPVSEKYDPNWCKRVNEMLTRIERGEFVTEKVTEVVSKEVKQLENVETTNKVSNDTVMFEESEVRKEVVFNENTRKEIDIMNIEKTAQTIVDESIERAVSVTEEIKKEFEVEMRELHKESTSEEKEELSLVSERNEVNEFVHTENRTTQEIQEVINVIDSEEITNEQLMQDEEFVEDRRMSTKKEMEEMIEAGNIKRKSSAYEKTDASLERNEEKVYNKQELEESISVRSAKSKTFNQEAIESKTEVSRKVSAKETGRELKSDENQEGKQKAFMIGLQTIPHIKGFVQSSYHFDLLLRTFFVHLTDVMVALSRFILTQPTKELEGTAERVIKEKLIKDLNQERREEYRQEKTVMKDELGQNTTSQVKDISRKVKKGGMQVNHEVTETKSQEFVNKKSINKEDRSIKQLKSNVESQESFKEEERKRKSGAEMALMSERKSKDLAQRMEAVITEFETKTGQERLEVNERRRSRSRSQIEEEVMKENDPLEWLDKVNKQVSQETDIVVKKEEKKRENFSSITESKSKTESKRESRQKSTKAGKQTYIAIVESHVYTNQDAILEDQALEMSETASVQSAEDIQAALESLETVSSERVAFNDVSIKKEQAVEVISKAIEEVVQEKQEALESVTNFESSNVVEQSKSVQKELLIKAALESIYTSNESKQESFESSEELNVSKIATKQAVTKQELLANVAAETVVAVTDSNVEKFEAKELNERKAIVKAEESYKTAAVEFEEVTLEATNEVTIESKSSKQAISKQELLATVAAESTEVITNSMLESFKTHETVTENATILSEDTFKTAAVESTELTLESAKEISELKMDVEQVTIKDTEQLETAEITETKTKICEKPAEDECASLKIIKHELIDGESTELSQISEEFVKKSLEISTSFQSHENVSIQESHTQISSEENFNKSEISSFQGSSVKLQVRTDLSTNDENNNTPSPSTVPPTPLTDEYVFKLVIPLPKNCDTTPLNQEETLNQEEKTLEAHEDPNIVKKKLVPHIETKIEEQIIYDPPLPTPTEDKVTSPVYCKPGLKGGAEPVFRKEYIREIERKSSLLASAIDQTIKSIEEYKEEVGIESKEVTIEEKKTKETLTNGYSSSEELKTSQVTGKEAAELKQEETKTGERDENVLPGFKPVIFNPEAYQANLYEEVIKGTNDLVIKQEPKVYVNESGEPLGTVQGIVDGLEDAVVDEEVAKELGKPGITEDKIAELISGESEMLREAHVMGLTRVLTSHMNRPDDCSVDFQKIKPLVDSLKDSEVIKVLNEELKKEKEKEKKEQEKKWTTFLQKPKRPVPRAKFGFHGNGGPEPHDVEEPYKVKIVKQPKPKVAPDYKPETSTQALSPGSSVR